MGAHEIGGVLALAMELDDWWRSEVVWCGDRREKRGAMGWFGGDGKRPSN